MAIEVKNLNSLFNMVMFNLRPHKRLYLFEEGREILVPMRESDGFYMKLVHRLRYGKKVADITYYHGTNTPIFVGTFRFKKYDTRALFVHFLWQQWLIIAFTKFYHTGAVKHGDASLKSLVEGAKSEADKKHYSAILAGYRSNFVLSKKGSFNNATLYDIPLYF